MRLTFYRSSGDKRPYNVVEPIPGTIVAYAGLTAPDGWLICSGATVSSTTYAALNDVIKTNFNTGGESAGTFRLPDLRDKAPMGVGTGSGLTARTINQSPGAKLVQLTAAESGFPSHSHPITESNHSHSISGGSNHTHQYGMTINAVAKDGGAYINYFPRAFSQGGSPYGTTGPSAVTWTISNVTSNITDGFGNSNVVGNQSATASSPHTNVQPSLVVNYIIKT